MLALGVFGVTVEAPPDAAGVALGYVVGVLAPGFFVSFAAVVEVVEAAAAVDVVVEVLALGALADDDYAAPLADLPVALLGSTVFAGAA